MANRLIKMAGPSKAGPSTPGPSTPGPSTAGPWTPGPSTAGPDSPSKQTIAKLRREIRRLKYFNRRRRGGKQNKGKGRNIKETTKGSGGEPSVINIFKIYKNK